MKCLCLSPSVYTYASKSTSSVCWEHHLHSIRIAFVVAAAAAVVVVVDGEVDQSHRIHFYFPFLFSIYFLVPCLLLTFDLSFSSSGIDGCLPQFCWCSLRKGLRPTSSALAAATHRQTWVQICRKGLQTWQRGAFTLLINSACLVSLQRSTTIVYWTLHPCLGLRYVCGVADCCRFVCLCSWL